MGRDGHRPLDTYDAVGRAPRLPPPVGAVWADQQKDQICPPSQSTQESLNAATRTGAAKPSDFSRVIVDTTVQPKAMAFPTDGKPMHRARERLVRLAKTHGVCLRQSYARVGKHALVACQRYAHSEPERGWRSRSYG
jgi:hypothetical protein